MNILYVKWDIFKVKYMIKLVVFNIIIIYDFVKNIIVNWCKRVKVYMFLFDIVFLVYFRYLCNKRIGGVNVFFIIIF